MYVPFAIRNTNVYWGLYLAGNNKHMTSVRLTDNDAHVLYRTLRHCMYITCLDLRYNNITDKGCEYVQQLIQVRINNSTHKANNIKIE